MNFAKTPLAAAVCAVLLCTQLHAQQEQMVAGNVRAVKVEGTAWQIISGSGQRERLKEGEFLRQGNAVETEGDGSVVLLFDNGSIMSLRPGTKFSINEFLRDPFQAQEVDYKKLKHEPSRSITKVKVEKGAMSFDIPKLKISKGSSCDISNPVGTAGIRGTAGFVGQNSMGCTSGSFQATTESGQALTLAAGQSTGFAPGGNFGPPPSDTGANMQEAQQNSQNRQENVPAEAFNNAPQPQPATQNSLTQEQKQAIEQAAKEGEGALVEAVKQIAAENPELAAAAAAEAAQIMPSAAPQVAAAAVAAIPQDQQSTLAPQIAAEVAKTAPNAAAQVAAAVASVATSAAPQVAAAVAQVQPNSAAEIAGAVAGVAPSQAVAIAQSVAQAAPSQANAVATAVTAATPDADAAAINNAAQEGAQQGQANNQSAGSSTGSSGGGTGAPLPPNAGGGGGGGTSGGGPIYSN